MNKRKEVANGPGFKDQQTGVFTLLDQAYQINAHVQQQAYSLYPLAVTKRDEYAQELVHRDRPEDAIASGHLKIAGVARDCELWATTPSQDLQRAVTFYREACAKMLFYIDRELSAMDKEVAFERANLGVYPERADLVRSQLHAIEKVNKYRTMIVDGYGHLLPALQVKHKGWAMDFYTANTDDWGDVAENFPSELVAEEEVIRSMPDHVRQLMLYMGDVSDSLTAGRVFLSPTLAATPATAPSAPVLRSPRLIRVRA